MRQDDTGPHGGEAHAQAVEMVGGLLRLAIGIGDDIRAGQEIAAVCNLFGEVVERIHAPRDGIARLIWAHKAVNTGDPVVKCWVVEEA